MSYQTINPASGETSHTHREFVNKKLVRTQSLDAAV